MTKKRFCLAQRFNNKKYGFRGGAAHQIKGIDQFGKLILGESILDVDYTKTSATTWATKSFTVDMEVDAFYRVIDKDDGYIYYIENGEYEIYATYKRDERKEILQIMTDKLGITNVEVTEENADIIATETEDTYCLKIIKFSYDTVADIKTIKGRKYNPDKKEWIIPKEQKEDLIDLNLKIIFN